ncbi:hypothetical protein C0Q70_17704 [Pomacea canaliculata]|uniref:Uncharacterized protein n=1 Tax=Pomacea canaliculata TaxID=400727 RepID=A0A2T7NL72_POMCA|nr:hypothetical protein C0Q70_17704 [Pomacea canaliculata]
MTAGLAGRCVTKGALSGPQHPSTVMAVEEKERTWNIGKWRREGRLAADTLSSLARQQRPPLCAGVSSVAGEIKYKRTYTPLQRPLAACPQSA